MALNRVILYGRITRDPEYRQTQSGTAVCKFTVACDRQFADKQTGKREADFINCTAWKNTADFVSRYFHKGDAITVEGALRNNNYTDNNGVKHYSMIVSVDAVGFGGNKQDSGNSNQSAPPQAAPAGEPISIDGFEEIISDGEVPF